MSDWISLSFFYLYFWKCWWSRMQSVTRDMAYRTPALNNITQTYFVSVGTLYIIFGVYAKLKGLRKLRLVDTTRKSGLLLLFLVNTAVWNFNWKICRFISISTIQVESSYILQASRNTTKPQNRWNAGHELQRLFLNSFIKRRVLVATDNISSVKVSAEIPTEAQLLSAVS